MSKNFDLVHSDEALLSRVLFLASSTELNVFVEDDGKEYEYEEILERLLPESIKINLIFPTGGKPRLEEAYELFGKSEEYGKCFFIADGDFYKALGRTQINASNFVYLEKYNIESYLIDESCIGIFMRPILHEQLDKTKQIIDFPSWKSEISSYFKQIFALHFIVQNNKLDIPNVSKGVGFFIENNGLPKKENLDRYIEDIERRLPNVKNEISANVGKLESIYGTDVTCFVCGKYLIESLARYLGTKLNKKKIGYEELERFLISNFNISSIEYIKDRLLSYIADI